MSDGANASLTKRVFAIADSHGALALVERLRRFQAARPIDAVLVCGDFSNFGDHCNALLEFIADKGIACALVSGNHETPELCLELQDNYGFHYLDYGQSVVAGMLITGLGGADLFTGGRPAAINRFASESLRELKGRFRVLLTHEPPSPWPYKGQEVGSSAVGEFVAEKGFDLVVAGHYHESEPRIDLWRNEVPIVNPGRLGSLVEIDKGGSCLRVMAEENRILFMHERTDPP